MKIINIKALMAAMAVIFALLLPTHSVVAAEADSSAKVCEDGKPCEDDEEPTDEELEDSCD